MPPLGYETSVDRGQRGQIIAMLRRETGFAWGGASLRLICGLGLTMFTCGVFAGVVAVVICRFAGLEYAGTIYLACFLLAAVWSIWRTSAGGDNPMMEEMRGYGSGYSQSYGEWEMRTTTASVWAWWEVLTSGPKLVFEAVATCRGRGLTHGVDMERAAETVLDLHRAGEGVRVAQLLHPGDSQEGMRKILAYLECQDWVGFSQDRQRVWLSSRMVARLDKLLNRRDPSTRR